VVKIKIKNRDVSFRITGRGNIIQFLPSSSEDLDFLDRFDELSVSKFLSAYATKKTKLRFEPVSSPAAGYSIEIDTDYIKKKLK